MGKKKKSRQPQESTVQDGGDSTESCDENQTNSPGGKCNHVNRAVDLNKVKKALKVGGLAPECPECVKEGNKPPLSEAASNPGLWLCLKCGHQGCGRTQQQHALKHYRIAHSDPHCIAVDIRVWNVWCYECEVALSPTHRKKMQECIKYLKSQDCPAPVPKISPPARIAEEDEEQDANADSSFMPLADVTNTQYQLRSRSKKSVDSTPSLPRVRGLRNLGNTCFFNAVLQCLAQTPFLLEVLYDMKNPGTKFRLLGGKGLVADQPDEELPPLEGELGKWGQLTEALATTLEELQADNANSVNPERLLNKFTQRCPQFGGGDQHDSHELLRHLLEEVRSEDLKRYWTVILGKHGLSRYDTAETVEEELRFKVQAYGRQAGDQLLHPEQVFRGILVSTLECQDCLHSVQRAEPFYELSLPVTANKPQPPVLRRKSSNEDAFDICGNPKHEAPSKHQTKKERKQQRIERKKQRGRGIHQVNGEPAIAEEAAAQNSAESEQSDADVEDNLEQEVALGDQNKDVLESGYSSEKAGNEDSAVESPASTMNGDSALASPDPYVDCKDGEHEPSPQRPLCNGTLELSSPVVMDRSHLSLPISQDSCRTPSQNAQSTPQKLNTTFTVEFPGISDSPPPLLSPEKSDCFYNNEPEENNKSRKIFSPMSAPNGPRQELQKQNELSVTIPVIPNPPVLDSTGSPSPVSSEVNIDINIPNNTNRVEYASLALGELNEDADRPFSRIAFCNDDDPINTSAESQTVPCSPESISEKRNGHVESKEALPGDLLVKEMSGLTLNHEERQSPSHWDTCSAHSLEDVKPDLAVDLALCNGNGSGDSKCSEAEAAAKSPCVHGSGDGACDKSATLAPRYHCEERKCSVESCLSQFTVLELMTGNNKVICENCSERINQGKDGKMIATNSTKQYLVSSPPAVLVLHFKRFEVHQNMFRKTPRHVSFPMVLDIAPICNIKCRDLPTMRHNQTKVLYSLYGVVQHCGSIHGGHYSAYIKVRPPVKRDDIRWSFLPTENAKKLDDSSLAVGITAEPLPGKWYYVSDSKVNEVNEERVLRSEAYLLFYERIW